ncbi:MAG: endonuclease/exonuclease/phosphatase family protein [Alphaproteobacteria bacterium]|nr:endonuclease/exonuclease/phosphatase family protein [Alphaproteobacteria bacterium]
MNGQRPSSSAWHRAIPLAARLWLALVALSFLGAWHPWLELPSHLRLHLTGAGVALAIATAMLRTRAMTLILVAAAGINLADGWSSAARPPAVPVGPGPAFRVVWANLQNWNTDLAALRHLVEFERPDLLLLTELAATHREVLQGVRPLLPFQSADAMTDPLAVLAATRVAPEAMQFDYGVGPEGPLAIVRFCPIADAACVTVLALHGARPWRGPDGLRDRQLAHAAAVARRRQAAGEIVALVGDLNTTPHAVSFKRLLAQSGLRDAIRGPQERPHPPFATWPTRAGAWGIAIDHVLVGPGLATSEVRRGPDIGSDHFPVIVDLRLPR